LGHGFLLGQQEKRNQNQHAYRETDGIAHNPAFPFRGGEEDGGF